MNNTTIAQHSRPEERDMWRWKAAAFGYNPKEKDNAKRLKLYSVEEYFYLTFNKETVKEWARLKLDKQKKYALFRDDKDTEEKFLKRVEQFCEVDLTDFMTINKDFQKSF